MSAQLRGRTDRGTELGAGQALLFPRSADKKECLSVESDKRGQSLTNESTSRKYKGHLLMYHLKIYGCIISISLDLAVVEDVVEYSIVGYL